MTELDLHRAAAQFLILAVPPGEMDWHHPPNGEVRSPRTAAKLKGMGVRAGVADFCCTLRGGQVGWIELKAAKGRLSPEQRAFRERQEALGARYAVVRSLDELESTLRAWGVRLRARAA